MADQTGASQIFTRSFSWSPDSTPTPEPAPNAVQVNTNGRGAVVWVQPQALPRQAVPAGGTFELTPRREKLMMDPRDPSTWQRVYRFT